MLRRIDGATGGKPVFAVSGIPGTVDSGTREFWRELGPLLSGRREFSVWPFEGDAKSPAGSDAIVLCEAYPRIAYAVALAETLPTRAVPWPKTRSAWRAIGCDCLARARWVGEHDVRLCDLDGARSSEDDFDAMFVAAAVLRCVLEDGPLARRDWTDEVAEGSILLAGALVLDGGPRQRRRTKAAGGVVRCYRGPIRRCTKDFRGSRAGWDKHIVSDRHPKGRGRIVRLRGRARFAASE